MSAEKRNIAREKSQQEDVLLEMIVDESKKGRYRLHLPLSYGIELTEVDDKGKVLAASAITLKGMQTVIKTPTSPAKWKLTVMNRSNPNNLEGTDPYGVPVTIDPDGSGDRITDADWLLVKRETLQKHEVPMEQTTSFRVPMRTIILEQ